MLGKLLILYTIIALFGCAKSLGYKQCAKRGPLFTIEDTFDSCEGQDVANYSAITDFYGGENCAVENIDFSGTSDDGIIAVCQSSGAKSVGALKAIAVTVEDMGAFFQVTGLSLVTSGQLQASYIIRRGVFQKTEYTKKCSSTLGSSYVTSTSLTLMISRKFDMNVMLTPGDPLEVFKKTATTVCTGRAYIIYNQE